MKEQKDTHKTESNASQFHHSSWFTIQGGLACEEEEQKAMVSSHVVLQGEFIRYNISLIVRLLLLIFLFFRNKQTWHF